jgi:hypothetical protein
MFEISFALTPNTPGKPGMPTMNDLDFCVSHCSTPQLLRSHPRGNSNYSLVKERYISAFAGRPISDPSSLVLLRHRTDFRRLRCRFALIYQPFFIGLNQSAPIRGRRIISFGHRLSIPRVKIFFYLFNTRNCQPKKSMRFPVRNGSEENSSAKHSQLFNALLMQQAAPTVNRHGSITAANQCRWKVNKRDYPDSLPHVKGVSFGLISFALSHTFDPKASSSILTLFPRFLRMEDQSAKESHGVF